jgi:hypothetical protein
MFVESSSAVLSSPQSSVINPQSSALMDQTKPDMIEVACLPGGATSSVV